MLTLIHWIAIYPVDSVIQPLNNWGLGVRNMDVILSVSFLPFYQLYILAPFLDVLIMLLSSRVSKCVFKVYTNEVVPYQYHVLFYMSCVCEL